MKKIFVFFICMISLSILQAKKLATLNEVLRPNRMVVDGDELFIVERTSIYIYSMKDYKLKKKFGKQGEGPQEFKILPRGGPGMVLIPFSDHILVNSQGKISYFTRDGKFIKERRTKPLRVIMPVKDNFISSGFVTSKNRKMLLCLNLLNSNLEKVKEIFRSNIQINLMATIDIPHEAFTFGVFKEKIFIPNEKEGFSIDVFDSNGEKIYSIRKEYKRLKVDNAYKKRILHWLKNESPIKDVWEQFKKDIKFKHYFPLIKDMVLNNEKIYIFTYKREKGLNECIIFDLKGNEQKRVFLPLPEDLPFFIPLCYSIQNDCFYTLVENEDDEVWELYSEEIK